MDYKHIFVPKDKKVCYKRIFFQKRINTPIGYLTRGQIIISLLGALVFLAFSWLFIVGLWMVIG